MPSALVGGRPEGRSTAGGWILLLGFLLQLALVADGLAQQAQPADPRPVPLVKDITVDGNRRIQATAILNRVQTKIGDPFAPAALRDDVRSIFGLGFFDDVQIRTEEFAGGIRVVFVVV